MNTMKLKNLLFLGIAMFFFSCGSQKNVTTTTKKITDKTTNQTTKIETHKEEPEKEVVLEELPKVITEPEVEKPIVQPKVVKPKTHLQLTQDYIEKFAGIAVEEMHEHKIPASITLAQGVLESGSGKSELALKSNNHFGIKCHKGWKGNSVSHDDDAIGECFRKYNDPEISYKDHSLFLTSRKRYANLFKLHPTDFTGWAYGLKKAGYATDPKYPQKLIGIINKYELYKYDLVENARINKNSSIKRETGYYTVKKGDTLYSIAKRNQITVEQLKRFNGLTNNIISIGQKLILN